MTVDGLANAVEEVDVSGLPIGPDNPYGNAIVQTVTRLTRESQAVRRADGSRGRTWRIVSTEQANRFGRPTGYTLYPEAAPALLADPESPWPSGPGSRPTTCGSPGTTRPTAGRRATSSTRTRAERASPPSSPATRTSTAPTSSSWHTFGPTHVPRPEDWPVMPVARCGFVLKPTGFFDRNPTLDVPPPARHCSAG